jgi:hypothetical protein
MDPLLLDYGPKRWPIPVVESHVRHAASRCTECFLQTLSSTSANPAKLYGLTETNLLTFLREKPSLNTRQKRVFPVLLLRQPPKEPAQPY